ncbi:MAG TPA: HlyD family efflux transporter periplasmic adaptor subunit, partial [Candidatus Binatia bacterium]|nr:HlyD family efflux transporter periplasmic adaptor subunit [Candidatus Binatia bacterium]
SNATPRERRIFLFYGLIAAAFSISLLGYLLVKLANFFAERNQGLQALAVTLFLAVGQVRRRLLRFFPQESKILFRRLGNAFRALKRPALAGAGLAAVFAAAYFLHAQLKVSGAVEMLPVQNADVRAQVSGICDRIFVDEGQRVHKGDQIAQLSDRDNQAELRKTAADLDQAQARLQKLVAGPRPEEIATARAEADQAEEQVKYAESTLARDKSLFQIKLLSQQDYETSQANLAEQQDNLAAAKSRLALLLAGSRPEDIAAAKADVAHLQAQQQYLEGQIKLAEVFSPADGIVATPSRQLKEMVHQLVNKGDLIAKVYDLKTIEAETLVSEKEIADVNVGYPVVLKVRAYPDQTFHGKVTAIATATAGQTGSDAEAKGVSVPSGGRVAEKMVLVTTQIDNRSLLLKPGMTGEAKILCGRRRIIDLVTRRIARTFKVQFWMWW